MKKNLVKPFYKFFEEALYKIIENPEITDPKKSDLQRVFTYKFYGSNSRIAYWIFAHCTTQDFCDKQNHIGECNGLMFFIKCGYRKNFYNNGQDFIVLL
ncbi:MAG: type II toxin-antitoxin system RelE/ParE family toxin [Saprospiraceae bacterium]|nr:type II toxin-antitoxin system RelE/ParE family toxin [Saprospiraceae bacterium]MBK9221654.1 type II toxin-antitoxin system RelE/ParE family toxin [Saprospiraceae bacterium]